MTCSHSAKRRFVLTADSHGYQCACGDVFERQHDASQDSLFGVQGSVDLTRLCGVDAFKIDFKKALEDLWQLFPND